MPYPEEMVAPMRAEVADLGVEELRTAAEVQAAMADTAGTALFFINSVCGCAAGSARPGLAASLGHKTRPDRLFTVFAGQDGEATAEVRSKILGIPPSSPSIALFKNGALVEMVERHHIQGASGEELGQSLAALYERHCSPAAV